MIKLKHLEFYNSPRLGRYTRFDLDLSKQFFILTGYNGAGKSRMISILTEMLEGSGSGKFNSPLSHWGCKVVLSNEAICRSLKMEMGGASRDDVAKLSTKFRRHELTLDKMFHAAKEMVDSRSKTRYTSDADADVVEHFCINGSYSPGASVQKTPSAVDVRSYVNLVSFIDESLYFNFSINGAEVAPEGKAGESNIDKTLWLLIHAYMAKRLDGDGFSDLYKKIQSFERDGDVDLNNSEVKSLIALAVEKLRDSSDVESGAIFTEINKFYGMTNRKLVWRDDTFQMVVPDEGVIPFPAFSKGEKTLLALLLAVSLYGDSSVFLLDEPDLSLHVEWQRMLLPAMQRLAPESQFIIGTHSPFLIMNTQSETIVNLAKKFKEEVK
ncbi:ATP-binding protein [Pseudomonas sp. B21-044]|uniref:ATP-binding protein n=1 Tax=Pseudomonas sp. B21-044 TaxID=2895488 RepID=UPI00215FA7D2|nr:ATP-binding protein [Pseudomonas sp. B21-044]UVL17674.1 ATP-binding protein [Pseudomonas sp. B21-044]